jgi:hypothetical protein
VSLTGSLLLHYYLDLVGFKKEIGLLKCIIKDTPIVKKRMDLSDARYAAMADQSTAPSRHDDFRRSCEFHVLNYRWLMILQQEMLPPLYFQKVKNQKKDGQEGECETCTECESI